MSALADRLRAEADLSEKGVAFMSDPDLAEETMAQVALLREAAEVAESYEFDVNVPLAELREQAERLHGALIAAAGLLERLGAWFIETKPPASKEFEVEIVQTIERIISDLQERDSGL